MTDLRALHLQQLTAHLNECLARFGMAGEIRCDETDAELYGFGPRTRTPLGDLLDRWPTLPHEERTQLCLSIVRKLVGERRASLPPSRPPPSRQPPAWLAALVLFALLAVAGHLLLERDNPGPNASEKAAPSAAAAPERESELRAERLCQATRARLSSGVTLGPVDAEGWVVELSLLRPGDAALARDPALGEFVSYKSGYPELRFSGAPNLRAAQAGAGQLEVTEQPFPGGKTPLRSLTLKFSARYAAPYFRDSHRGEFIALADALTARLGATHAGLYARCAGSPSHHLGSWFLGPDAAGAAASLIYFMSADALPPVLTPGVLLGERPGSPALGSVPAASSHASAARGSVFERIQSATAVTPVPLAEWTAAYAGQVTSTGSRTTVSFPFQRATRAARASHALARRLGVGLER